MSLKMGKIKLTGSLQMGGSGGGAKLPIHYNNDNELVNRPHINSHELIGDKTGEELGLADASQIVSITERIDGHDAQIGDMQTQIDDIETDVAKISTLETDVAQLKTDVAEFDEELQAIETDVADVKTDVQTLSETVSSFDGDITQLKSDVSNHADAIANLDETVAVHTTAIENNAIDISDLELSKADKTYVDGLVDTETTNRENADNQLQEQIDAIVSSTDVKDVVGTYTELENYDTSTLGDKDIIKVLEDSTHDGARTYYRWDLPNEEWDYVGSEGAYYTKAESDSKYVPQTRTINGKALSNNISLDYSDTGSQPTLVSGTNIKTINNESLLGGGNINIETGGATRTIKIAETTYQEAYDILTSQRVETNYGVMLIQPSTSSTYVAMRPNISSDRITFSFVRAVADKLITLQQCWVTTDDEWGSRLWYAPTNNNLKTINNISLIGTENIEVQEKLVSGTNLKTINNQTLLGAENIELQETLVSGTNIKTINNESLLGSGNIDIESGSEIFVATYGETTFADIEQAYNENKTVWLIKGNDTFQIASFIKNGNIQFVLHRLFATSLRLLGYTYFVDKVGDNTYWSETTYLYPSTTNLKTINNESIIGSGNIDVGGTVDTQMSDSSENAVQNKVIKSYVDTNASKIDKIKIENAELPIIDKTVSIPNYIYAITRTQYSLQAHNVNGVNDNALTISKPSGSDRLKFLAWDKTQQETVFDIDVPNATELGDLSLLTTDDKTSLVNALNEVYEKSGEPFRVKNWTGSWADGVTIPVCTKDISNTQIAKLTFSIDAVEGADYQIVGMIAYEVFDAVSGGNRLNVWPVCQFTGNGQKELSVRWTCMGTTDKVAKRINAWVLLKHR